MDLNTQSSKWYAATTNSWTLSIQFGSQAAGYATLATTALNWSSNPFNLDNGETLSRDEYGLKAFTVNSVDFTSVSSLTDTVTSNALMFTRTAEVINTSAAEIISGARTGDIFVLEGADIVTGGLGTDRYEIRLLENDGGR